MKNSKPSPQNWEPCHPGMIQEAAQETFTRRRLFQIVGTGVALGVVGGGTVLGIAMSDNKQAETPGLPPGIACITVHDHLATFVAGQLNDVQLENRISAHLLKCRGCRDSYEELCCGNCESRPKKVVVRPCHHHSPAP